MSIFDIDNYTDAVKNTVKGAWDVVTSVADAGHLIGNILKGISPALSFIPGLGTGLAVGFYAAGAIASADKITDIVIGTVSAGMPPGIPRIAFDGAANISKDIAQGHNAFQSAVEACRQTATQSGPQARAAFDAALNMARGGKIDPRLLAEAKASFSNGGTTAAMAFDAGVGIAKGEKADQIVLDVARNYIRDAGGPLAAASFDSGVALAYGQTLQEAGWAGLHTLVRGNNPVEMIIEFVKQVGLANAAGISVHEFLENSMVKDAISTLKGAAPAIPNFSNIIKKLDPIITTFQNNLPAIDIPSGELAKQWGIDEALVRAAQSAVDRETGAIKKALLDKFNISDAPGTSERNDNLALDGQAFCNGDPLEMGYLRRVWEPFKTPAWLRGFDIGTAVCHGFTTWGEGQANIRNSLMTQDQYDGFNFARDHIYAFNTKHMNATLNTQLMSATVISSNLKANMSLTASNQLMGATTSSVAANLDVAAATLAKGDQLGEQGRSDLASFAHVGAMLADGNPTLLAARSNPPNKQNYSGRMLASWAWGFDVGTAVSSGYSEFGDGQSHRRDLLNYSNAGPNESNPSDYDIGAARNGYDAARAIQYQLTLQGTPMRSPDTSVMGQLSDKERGMLVDFVRQGIDIAAQNSTVRAVRSLIDDGLYRWGFDFGSGSSKGYLVSGPGQEYRRNFLNILGSGPVHDGSKGGPVALQGFDAARALQYGIGKGIASGNSPGVVAGSLIVNGLTGSGMTPNQKASVVSATLNNQAIGAGAAAQVAANNGFFHRLAVFFGLA